MAPKRKTQEEFEKEVFDLVGDEYTVIGKYINTNTNIMMRHNCKKCNNNEYPVKPSKFLHGSRCPACAELSKLGRSNKKKTQEEFEKEVFDLVGDEYTVIGKYISGDTNIMMRHNCKKCNNYEYPVIASNFTSHGDRCPKCSGKMKKTQEEFEKEVFDLVGDEYTVLGEYSNNKAEIWMRHNCTQCENYEYPVKPNDFLQGTRCPKCNEMTTTYKGEEKIKDYLNRNNYSYIHHHSFINCKNINKLKFDFYLNNYNLIIEFDGSQHWAGWQRNQESKLEQQKRDRIKDKYCIDNNITILRIAYKELDNLDNILDTYFNNQEFDSDTNIFLYKEDTKLIQGIYKDIIDKED